MEQKQGLLWKCPTCNGAVFCSKHITNHHTKSIETKPVLYVPDKDVTDILGEEKCTVCKAQAENKKANARIKTVIKNSKVKKKNGRK